MFLGCSMDDAHLYLCSNSFFPYVICSASMWGKCNFDLSKYCCTICRSHVLLEIYEKKNIFNIGLYLLSSSCRIDCCKKIEVLCFDLVREIVAKKEKYVHAKLVKFVMGVHACSHVYFFLLMYTSCTELSTVAQQAKAHMAWSWLPYYLMLAISDRFWYGSLKIATYATYLGLDIEPLQI